MTLLDAKLELRSSYRRYEHFQLILANCKSKLRIEFDESESETGTEKKMRVRYRDD